MVVFEYFLSAIFSYPLRPVCRGQVVMPNKASQVALIDSDKGNILDVRTRRFLRSVPRWNGSVTRDGKYGLFAPARGGLEVSPQGGYIGLSSACSLSGPFRSVVLGKRNLV